MKTKKEYIAPNMTAIRVENEQLLLTTSDVDVYDEVSDQDEL